MHTQCKNHKLLTTKQKCSSKVIPAVPAALLVMPPFQDEGPEKRRRAQREPFPMPKDDAGQGQGGG